MQWPSKNQWGQFFKVLSSQEKILFSGFLFLFLASLFFLIFQFYLGNTTPTPAEGGNYVEGALGFPRWINPIYSPSNDPDHDLTQLIFSGLMKYDSQGKIVPDLVERYEILEDGKIWEFYLKENVLWQDGKQLGADDVIFTIEIIQNADIKSPLRANWLGVEAEKISERALRFSLKNESAIFLENCTVKIIPKHIWEQVLPQNFPLSSYNLKPIGSGPYKLKNLAQDEGGKIVSIDLNRNPYYYGSASYIPKISFHFFETQDELTLAFRKGMVDGLSLPSPLATASGNLYALSLPRYFSVFFNLNQSAGGTQILAEKEVRQALNYAIDKQALIDEALPGQAKIVESPILPEMYGLEKPSKIYQYDPALAEEMLEKAGFAKVAEASLYLPPNSDSPRSVDEEGKRVKVVKKTPAFQFKSDLTVGSQNNEVKELQKCLAKDSAVYPEGEVTGYFGSKTKTAVIKFQEKYKSDILVPAGLEKGTGDVKSMTRKKLNEVCFETGEEKFPLKFTLTTVEQPLLVEVANQLKSQWQKIGVELEIKTYDLSILEKDVIKPRKFEALLFGEVLGAIPDPFSFWHSSQKKDPGLNLASYDDKESDKLLEEARQSSDEKTRKEKLEKFQNLLIEQAPCVFLYTSDYLYMVSKEIKGIKTQTIFDPSQRFSGIEEWYIKTKRIWQ